MSFRTTPVALVAASILSCAPMAALAQEGELDRLEQRLRGLAEQTIPKTVLIKAIAGPGREGAGSGAIISPDGYILTCTHVVEIGESLEVTTSDGKTYRAELVGRNESQDYSLIKIDAKGLSVFTIGDSDTVKLGDWVSALGHPGGPYRDVQPAFAAGRVRALGMKLPVGMMKKYYNNAIMTDVPIYAGDSGGPLVNAKGELIGINGAIVQINEMAFAIPINQIMANMARLKAGEVIPGEKAGPEAFREMQKVISPEDYQKMTKRMFKNFGRSFGGEGNPFGKLFGGENGLDMEKLMDPDGPLGKLFGGQGGEDGMDFGKLMDPDGPLGKLFGGGGEGNPFGGEGGLDLEKLMDPDGPLGKLFGGEGGELDLGKLMDPDGPLGKLFGGEGNPFGGEGNPFGGEGNPFGKPEQPAPEAAKSPYLGLRGAPDADLGGVLVEEVQPDGPAAKGGLTKGDLIVQVSTTSIKSLRDLQYTLRRMKPGQKVQVKVVRSEFSEGDLIEVERTLTITLGAR